MSKNIDHDLAQIKKKTPATSTPCTWKEEKGKKKIAVKLPRRTTGDEAVSCQTHVVARTKEETGFDH